MEISATETHIWKSLEHRAVIITAEWLIFAGNCIWVLQNSSVMHEPNAVIFNLGVLATYRYVLFNRLNAGSPIAAWWYCVTAALSALRFSVVLIAEGNSIHIASLVGIVFIASVIVIRSFGAAAIFYKDLRRTSRITAGIIISAALIALPIFFSEVLLLSGFDGWIYGANVRLH